MNKNSYAGLIAFILLVCSPIHAERVDEVVKEFATFIESSDAVAFQAAYSQLAQDTRVPLDDKIGIQKELIQAVIEQKKAINQALALEAQVDKKACFLSFYMGFNALFAIAVGLSACPSKHCSKKALVENINNMMKAHPKTFRTLYFLSIPFQLPFQLACRSFQVCGRSVYLQFPLAVLSSAIACQQGRSAIGTYKKARAHRKNLEHQLEQLISIESFLLVN